MLHSGIRPILAKECKLQCLACFTRAPFSDTRALASINVRMRKVTHSRHNDTVSISNQSLPTKPTLYIQQVL